MKTIQTRVYTNVILTAIAVLLAVLAFQPVMQITSNAHAQRERNLEPERDYGSVTQTLERSTYPDLGGDTEQADAQREIAAAIQELARAVESSGESAAESAEAQREIADAIRSLGNL